MSTNNAGGTYDWNFGDGTAHDTTSNPTHQYTTPGSYTVTQKVTTAAGTNTATRIAYVNPGCIIPVYAGVASGSAGAIWTAANFSSNDLNYYQGAGKGYDKKVPSSSYPIALQNPQGGLFLAATKQGSNYNCSPGSNPERVAPTGANPLP
jgi:PKD repeat protein